MKRRTSLGFTLVEIMIVVAIIALLAAIAIPNLLRVRMKANDSLAADYLKNLSTATEVFATSGFGVYPSNISLLTSATPPYISENYCGDINSGFTFTCTNTAGSYSYVASPVTTGKTGTTTYTMTTGGILTP